jgi:hypothetical protein
MAKSPDFGRLGQVCGQSAARERLLEIGAISRGAHPSLLRFGANGLPRLARFFRNYRAPTAEHAR